MKVKTHVVILAAIAVMFAYVTVSFSGSMESLKETDMDLFDNGAVSAESSVSKGSLKKLTETTKAVKWEIVNNHNSHHGGGPGHHPGGYPPPPPPGGHHGDHHGEVVVAHGRC